MPLRFVTCLIGCLLAASPCLVASAEEAAGVDFAKDVEPIFSDRCYKCHGEKRGLGDLRMHTPELITGMVDDGLLVEGDPESSELYTRLTLPADDSLRMPKGGDPLDKEQIEIVKRWIEGGALLTTAKAAEPAAGHDAHGEKKAAEQKEDLPAPPAASPEAIKRLQAAGATVVSLYTGSPLLSVSFPSGADKVDDATIEQLLTVTPNIAWLDLGNTKVTDAGVRQLAAMTNLSRLHLEKTAITDAAIGALTGLGRLEYLNLYQTQVTDSALAELEALPKLERLYVWQTGVTFDAAKKLEAAKEGLEVNLGWNHPGVIRERLNAELERVTAAHEAAAKDAEEAEKKLAAAKETLEASTARETEINAELAALDKPTDDKPTDDKPTDDKPTDDKRADDKPADDKPADDKPADDLPAEDKPAGDESAETEPESKE